MQSRVSPEILCSVLYMWMRHSCEIQSALVEIPKIMTKASYYRPKAPRSPRSKEYLGTFFLGPFIHGQLWRCSTPQ
jgi:hypothetical protein